MTNYAGTRPEKIRKIENKFFQDLIIGKIKNNSDEYELKNATESDDETENSKDASFENMIFQSILNQFSQTVRNNIEHQLAEPVYMLPNVGITDVQVRLMEILQVGSPDINRVSKQVELLSWLIEELENVVNGSSFQHKKTKNSDVKVTDLKLIMSYIGMEKLKTLLPSLCAKNWLPKNDSSLALLRKKLWRYSSIMAATAGFMATKSKKNPIFFYISALLYALGISVIISKSFTIFELTKEKWLESSKAFEDEAGEIHEAIVEGEFPVEFIYEYVLDNAYILNWQLIELVHFEGSQQSRLLKELYSVGNFNELSDDASVLARASCFAKLLMLEESHRIRADERELLCNYYYITEEDLAELRKLSFNPFDFS